MRKQSGFTIIELMIVVAIAGVLAAVALPNYTNMVKNNCLTTTNNNLVSSLQLARSEAIKRRKNVGVMDASAWETSADWAIGWLVFEDKNSNGAFDYDDKNGNGVFDFEAADADEVKVFKEEHDDEDMREEVIRVTENTCGIGTLEITSSNNTFLYGSEGFIHSAGRFTLCDDRDGETGRRLAISPTGRPSSGSATCS